MSSNPTYTSLGHYKLPASHSVICGRTEYYENHASHPWSYHARTKPGNGTTLAKRQSSPRRSERYRLSISCCILSRWPMATGQALPVLQHLECTVQRSLSLQFTYNLKYEYLMARYWQYFISSLVLNECNYEILLSLHKYTCISFTFSSDRDR